MELEEQTDILLKSHLSEIKNADSHVGRNPYLNLMQNPGYAKTPSHMEMKQKMRRICPGL